MGYKLCNRSPFLSWTREDLIAEVQRLRMIVRKIPRCWRLNEVGELVRDVPMMLGMKVWYVDCIGNLRFNLVARWSEGERWTLKVRHGWVFVDECYDSREAAIKAID